MPKSKLTLIVDGNWLLMSRLSVLNNRFADEYELNQELKLMLIKSINKVLRFFPFIDNIIFVADGGSWRNQLEIPQYIYDEISEIQSPEYKGNRVRSDDIDWDLLFSSYNDFITTLQSTGITSCQENGGKETHGGRALTRFCDRFYLCGRSFLHHKIATLPHTPSRPLSFL